MDFGAGRFLAPAETEIAGTFYRPDVKGGMSRVSCIIS